MTERDSTETSVLGKRKRRGRYVAGSDYAQVAEVVGWLTEVESFEEFEYTPLLPSEEIRLLKLLPSLVRNDTIRCELYPVSSSMTTTYQALSYTWGDENMEMSIQLNGRQFFIGSNLWWALHHLRQATFERVLWIDAVCINQNDNSERSAQVKIMGSIYANALEVLVWLGRSQRGTEDNASLFESVAAKAARYLSRHPKESEGKSYAPKHMKYCVTSDEMALFMQLAGQDYWNRVWIIQEVILAKTVRLFYGPTSLPWAEFVSICKWFRRSEMRLGLDITNFDRRSYTFAVRLEKQRLERSTTQSRELVSLVNEYGLSKCKDPRDKIYGLRSLAVDGHYIQPDYLKSILEVYWEMIWFQNVGGKEYSEDNFVIEISAIGNHGEGTVRFSQFLNQILGDSLLSKLNDDIHSVRFSAMRLLSPYPDLPKIVAFAGKTRSEVLQMGPIHSMTGLDIKKIRSGESLPVLKDIGTHELRRTEKLLQGLDLSKFVLIRSSNSYAVKVPAHGISSESLPELQDMGKYLDFTAYREIPIPSQHFSFEGSGPARNKSNSLQHRLFVDNNNCIGLGPEGIRENDVLCKFDECDVVAAMRQHQDRYVFVGRAALFPFNVDAGEERAESSAKDGEMLFFADAETLLRLTL